ncbi:MAG: hypothetical protein P0Y66_22390 [Candidatus Kaistia colombiensis]|nr:MAG: hypothetical protein P0Y66_22390 [Kaistia sp.]
MTFSSSDIVLYLVGGLALFTLITMVVFEWLNHEPDEDPSEFSAHWRDDR